jgi:cyclic dehypoxanthinyl futalosine synthase
MKGMDVLEKAVAGERLSEAEVLSLFDLPLPELAAAAHEVRLKKTPRW